MGANRGNALLAEAVTTETESNDEVTETSAVIPSGAALRLWETHQMFHSVQMGKYPVMKGPDSFLMQRMYTMVNHGG